MTWVLQVSRLFPEQCEAEGLLLRSGALDLSEEGLARHDTQHCMLRPGNVTEKRSPTQQ